MQVWYKRYTKGPKNGLLRNCANTGIDMLYKIAERKPQGYDTLEAVVNDSRD